MKIRLAMIAGRDHASFEGLAELLRPAGLEVEPAFVPSYAAMYGVLEHRVCAIGWAPPLVAADLLRGRDVDPIALVARNGSPTYWSALVTKRESRMWHVGQLAQARIGWVSRLSAAGYVVPRAHLSLVRVSLTFAKETFHHTHARLAEALASDAVDAIATYAIAQGGICVPHVPEGRILGVAGPIPGELVVSARGLDVEIARAATDALRGQSIDGVRFLEPPSDYAKTIDALGRPPHSGPELEEDPVAQARAWG
jgi:ABC-type phosphate/phosphonate transport system substrate-binding protein